jgi:DNA polymerase-3 subunit delta
VKLDARRIEAFLRDPGAARVVLLHGEDAGLIRERASRLVRAVAGSLDDPFRVVELGRDAFGSMAVELASISLTGGRRAVLAREVTDSALTAVTAALEGPGQGLLVLEAPGLGTKSKLVTLLTKPADAAVIACYPPDEGAVTQTIRSVLSEAGVGVDDEALAWLRGRLGADQALTRAELEKLVLYAGPGGQVDLEAARNCVGDLAGLSLEDALFAATSGDVASADRALELAMAEGAAPVGVMRAMLGHLQRLQRAREAMAAGISASEAMRGARPPVFFRRQGAFTRALTIWSQAALEQACQRAWDAEALCKRTGSPAETICRNAVIGLAQRGAAAARR